MTPRKRPAQRTIAKLGPHGRRVRIWREGALYRVQCRAIRLTKSYRGDDAEALAYGFAQRLAAGDLALSRKPAQLSLADLWDRYRQSSDFRQLRPRSVGLYGEAWRLFIRVVGHETDAASVTAATLETVRAACEDVPRPTTGRPYAVNTIRKALGIVKGVFAWAERVELLDRNRVHAFRFKVAKEKRPETPAEYTAEEAAALLQALSFDTLTQRTPCVVMHVLGQGVRIGAALHLRWEDVDWAADQLHWRPEFDKVGHDWYQPMRPGTRAMLARWWEAQNRPETGCVFPARRKRAASPTYSEQSFWWALRAAEERAGIPHLPGRAAHSFRRKIAGDIADKTGSALMAMEGIGDRGIGQAPRYVQRRQGRIARALKVLDEGVA